MIPSRWELRRWGKNGIVAGIAMIAIAALLERAENNARSMADARIKLHQHNEHDQSDGET